MFLSHCVFSIWLSISITTHLFGHSEVFSMTFPWSFLIEKNDNKRSWRSWRLHITSASSKILEKKVANRLQAHIKNNHLSNLLQSAYRKHHSTESAVLKVHNDTIISMDKGAVTALTLLDLSATFDTIDHATLTDRLSDWYGISGQAQIWFSSYLQKRHHSVKIEDTFSDKVTLSW